MSTNFPSALDSLLNPASSDTLALVDHAKQHADANDAIEALEGKVGVNSSLVTTSLDYLVKKELPASGIGGGIAATSSKSTLANADLFGISDSAAANVLKRLSFTDLKSNLVSSGYVTSAADVTTGVVSLNSKWAVPWVSHGLINTVIIGDSFTSCNNGGAVQITAATRTSNVVTATVASTGGFYTGQRASIFNMLDSSFCANDTVITVISGTQFSYASIGSNGSTSNLSASAVMCLLDSEVCSDYGAFSWLNAKSGGAFCLLHNGGCNGQTAADMLARFSRDCLSYSGVAKLVILNTGYNDFAVNSRSAQNVYDDISSMALQAVNAGMKVVILGALPWTSGVNAAFLPVALKYNRLIRWFCNVTPNCRYADSPSYIVNPTSATYAPISGMLNSDGIHPSSRGGERQGQALWDVLQYEAAVTRRLISTVADTPANNPTGTQLHPQAPWTNTGGALAGGATGVAASGWAVTNSGSGTSVGSAPAGFDGIGYSQQAVFTPAASNDSCVISTAGYTTTVVPGTLIVASMKISLSGLSGSTIRSLEVLITWSGGQKAIFRSNSSSGAASSYCQTDQTITLISNPITVPAGVTAMGVSVTANASGAGSAFTFALGRVSIESVVPAQVFRF